MESENPTTKLPGPSELITSIVNELSTIEPESGATGDTSGGTCNPLSSLHPDTLSKAKPLLLTLHCLFPNELLLALDILDKKLVKKCSILSPGRRQHQQHQHRQGQGQDVYFVRSQSTLSSSATTATAPASGVGMNMSYEVHLHSWHCTCPAFTLAMVRGLNYDDSSDEDDSNEHVDDDGDTSRPADRTSSDWIFGGYLTTTSTMRRQRRGGRRNKESHDELPTCCKHLLACVLAAQCPRLFSCGIEEVDIELGAGSPASSVTGEPSGSGKKFEVAAWHSGWYG